MHSVHFHKKIFFCLEGRPEIRSVASRVASFCSSSSPAPRSYTSLLGFPQSFASLLSRFYDHSLHSVHKPDASESYLNIDAYENTVCPAGWMDVKLISPRTCADCEDVKVRSQISLKLIGCVEVLTEIKRSSLNFAR